MNSISLKEIPSTENNSPRPVYEREHKIKSGLLEDIIALVDTSKDSNLFIGFGFLPDGDRALHAELEIKEDMMKELELEGLIKITKFRTSAEIHDNEIYGCYFTIKGTNSNFKKKLEKKKIFFDSEKIQKIDVLEDKNERKKITLYINENYSKPLETNRGPYFISLYNLARDGNTKYDKGFFDYFNSNNSNPLYSNQSFTPSKILKKDRETVIPNIPITLRTQKFITQAKNKNKSA